MMPPMKIEFRRRILKLHIHWIAFVEMLCEAVVLPFEVVLRAGTHGAIAKSLADGAGWKDCGFGWQSMEVSLKLEGWAMDRRVLFIRRPTEKKAEVVEPKRRGRTEG